MKTTVFRAAAIVALALVAVSPAVPAAAQTHCTSWVDTLLDTTSNCVSEPWRPRASDVETFHWKGHDYVIMNIGNELSIFNIDDPTNPVHTATSDFDFGTRGDSDYDLIDFDVCDDCRYAVLSHKVKRTVVFDLGAAATPDFPAGAWAFYDGIDSKIGGYVFSKGSQQYLFTAGLPGGCSTGSTLYTINGVSSLGFIDCVEVGGAEMLVKGVHPLDTGTAFYLFTGAQNGVAQVFRADGAGAALSLVHVASPAGMWGRRYELSIDRNNDLLASANFTANEIQIWDVANPASPQRLWTLEGQASNVSLRSPSANTASTLMFNVNGWPSSTRTFTVDTAGPVEFEAEYWTDPSLPHNDLPVCAFASGGALSPDGSTAFISRYAIHQVFDLSDCLDPTPAVANLAISPSEAFPGDTVTVRDTTTGRYDRWAVWITQEPVGTVVAGTTTPSGTNPHEISLQIPQNLAWGTGYKAHVKVESDELPPDLALFETDIVINRAPEATISVAPPTVVVGDSVTLTATAEGNPASNPYTWTIDPPSGANFFRDGASTAVTLDQAGVWSFYLTVDYLHYAATGTYQATAAITGFNVTSVAADFTITPTSPLSTQPITLNGSISKPVGGNLSYQWAVQSLYHVYTGCPAAQVCTIPAESLSPNTAYSVTLTVTNNDDEATSQKTRTMFVNDGAIDPAIVFSPTNPAIGQNVVFTINGVEGDITKATWTMGGSGCDGLSAVQVCTPTPPWVDCKALSFKYASAGNKTVGLEVEIGSNTFTADPVTLTVASSGSCTGGGGGTCAYELNPTTRVVAAEGATSNFAVNQVSGTGCSFTASTTFPWITVLSPTGSDSGSGTVTFRVDANTGPQRLGSIVAGGKSFTVNQNAPWVPANFTMSNPVPEIGEFVTFSVDPILEVTSWDFGEADCNGNSPFINCTYLPGGVCNTMQWAYPSSGTKSITMVLADGRTQTKGPTVQTVGECCFKDGRPDASFTMSDDEIYAGEIVYFTDTSAKSALHTKALGIGWTPPTPEIGDDITFSLSGVEGTITKATWDFGDAGCEGPSSVVCVPDGLWVTCSAITFAYASGGAKPVSVTLDLEGGGNASAGPVTVNVANTGTCDEGGGGGCLYTLSSTSEVFPPEGGSGSVDVTTTDECAWTATTTSTWLTIDSGEGLGSGTVAFTVDANPGLTVRSAIVRVEDKTFKVTQTADEGDTAPTAWQWTVTRIENEEGLPVEEQVGTSTDQNFSFVFRDPGLFQVSLIASNCFGSDAKVEYVSVEEALVEDFVVAAAVSLPGLNLTQWESDFRFFNPCDDQLDVRIEYQPEDVNNAGVELIFREFQLEAGETRLFGDITDAIPGLVGEELSGSVRIESSSASGCKVLSVSRTFNDTPNGTLGLLVPALPVKRVGRDFLDLTGLIHNQDYRTNLRLVNYSDEDAWVSLVAYDNDGTLVGGPKSARVKGQSTKQLSAVSEWLGITQELEAFTIRTTISGVDVEGFATVVDNISGDSVLYLSSFRDENQIWVVGVASLAGLNDSNWRTDLWLHNPTEDMLAGQVEFVVGDNPNDVYGFNWPTLAPHQSDQYLDIVSDQLGLEEVYGYIVLTGADGGPAPQVSARTYDRDLAGGTYGLNIHTFGGADLLRFGEIAYIPGISNSDDLSVGYRTNVGVLNTDLEEWAALSFTMYDVDGTPVGSPYEMTIAPGKLKQFDIFKKFGLGNVTASASLEIEITSGGGVAVYATEIDNRSQDSIFIPALRKYMGLAR
jgi:PKD repeat protein